MTKNLNVKVTAKQKDGSETFAGTVTIPGLKPTRLVKKSDGTSEFTSVSALKTTARTVARKLGYDGVEVVEPKRKVAKSKVKSK